MNCRNEDIDKAAEELRGAASAFADRLVGSDVNHHLRGAARHLIAAMRGVLDCAQAELDKTATASGGPDPAPEPVDTPPDHH